MTLTNFVCLDPKKAKRALIAGTLSAVGTLTWRKFAPLQMRGYPETEQRAAQAFEAARTKPQSALVKKAKLALFALQYNGSRALFSANTSLVAVCWNGLNGTRRAFMDGAKDAGARRLFFELAPFPGRITVDPNGVNFENSLPRTIQPYLDWFSKSGLPEDGWRAIGKTIRQRAPLHPTVENSTAATGLDTPFLFVPLQTPGDSQLRLFGGNFSTVEGFIKAIGEAATYLPQGWHIRIKEHPTADVTFADLILSYQKNGVVLDNSTDTFVQVAASRGVITVNSSVGLEAMFFDKPVLACGKCFWAIDGVAVAAPDIRALSQLFLRPGEMNYDHTARTAFLSYLLDEYYIAIQNADIGRIKAKLQV